MTIEQHLAALDRSAALHDKQIKATRALLQEGMRLMVETRKDIRALATAQKRTEALLQASIEGRRASNGHTKRKVDLQ